MSKVSIAKGMRDFSSREVARRQYIINKIREVFEVYGFSPLETPSMENLSTLTGKYGEEGDKLIFRVLKSGDFLKSVPDDMPRDAGKWSALVADKALRYDLTVPFARYIATSRNDIKLPFKRYRIQPVWRADRPQKGRFREFFQCDADVVGSDSLWQEVELMLVYAKVFEALSLPVTIRISNRNILAGMAKWAGVGNQFAAFCTILDKVDKIGKNDVIQQWIGMGMSPERASEIGELISKKGNEGFDSLKEIDGISNTLNAVSFIIRNFETSSPVENISLIFDPSLARGLDYYTGCIFEVECPEVQIGSIGGGGRYADLTGIFGVNNVPGVGISFGLDRIYLALEELNLFPYDVENIPVVLGLNFGDRAAEMTFSLITRLRNAGVNCEFYPDNAKIKKQFDYANQRNIPYVLIIGDEEADKGVVSVKNMITGDQQTMSQSDIAPGMFVG
jgi:histidyl-tRNA synthetase